MDDLDPKQQQAVEAGPVDLFVSAGAGSGKTRVLVTRFVRAVLGVEPYEATDPARLLTVTFTEKAAGELAERVRRHLVVAGAPDAARRTGESWISTIHGMCARILRQHAFEAGLDPEFVVLDEVEAATLEMRAFEEAAAELVERDPAVAELLFSYGTDTVVSAARDMRAGIRALGKTVRELETISPDEVRERLASSSAEFERLAADFEACGQSATVLGNAASARAAAGAIAHALDGRALDPTCVLEALKSAKFKKGPKSEEHNALVAEAKALLAEATTWAAQAAVAPAEAAMQTLLHAFEERYERLKRARSALDFEDLQTVVAELLETRPALADELRRRFAMVMIDEFQDTNELQVRIVERIARGNLATVGDEFQSIYAFRHADVEVFRRRARAVPKRVELDINYRTDAPLLRALNGLFSAEPLFGRAYMALREPHSPPDLADAPAYGEFEVRFVDWSEPGGRDPHAVEANVIAERCQELLDAGFAPGQVTVLLTAMRGGRAEAVARALDTRGIRATLSAGGRFFECREVAEARALLRVIDNVLDDEALLVVLAGSLTGLSAEGLFELGRRVTGSAEPGKSNVRWWTVVRERPKLSDAADAATLARTVDVIEWARRARGSMPLGSLLSDALLRLDADLALLASGPEGVRAWSNLVKLVRMAEAFERASGSDVHGFLEHLSLREAYAAAEQEAALAGEAQSVRVMSVHAAKGLEFPAVVVGGLSTTWTDTREIGWARVGGVPLLGMRLRDDDQTWATRASALVTEERNRVRSEESKRLLYVACTRAQHSLTLVGRLDPAKEADLSLIGRVRRALGMGAPGAIVCGERRIGEGRVTVELCSPTEEPPPVRAVGSVTAPGELPPLDPTAPAGHAPAPRRLSYTALAEYASCPYRFYLTRVARMLPAPERTDAAARSRSFGAAVHAVLERVWRREEPREEVVHQVARAFGVPADDIGRLRAAAERFDGSPLAAEVRAAERVLVEVPMAVPLGEVVLEGAMDVLAWRGLDALVVDYKTGAGVADTAEAEARYGLQAACYALGALSAGAASVRVAVAEVETGNRYDFAYGRGDQSALEASLGALALRITRGAFDPRDGYDASVCDTCPGLGGPCPVKRDGAAG